jgi:diaminohydroxyphosphoribosylaminopyrimidine deaminase/5-amino-6-(5-phosphoribosylamino)uracil reductase
MILTMGIGKVVISQTDPNPVASGGIQKLRDHGIEVITGVLENESRHLNCRFNTFHEKKRPYLILKWAQTGDGFVDSLRDTPDNQQAAWITDETCRRLVHKWRSEEQAILAGSRTILLDNPNLNTRSWSGKNPLRITIDRKGILPYHQPDTLHLLNGKIPTVIYTSTAQTDKQNLEFVQVPSGEPVWPLILSDLHNKGIQSVLIEGGPKLFESLIHEDLWDEARVFIGPGWFGNGIRAPHFPYEPIEQDHVGNSQLLRFMRVDKQT